MNTRGSGVRISSGSPFQIDEVGDLAGLEAADAIGDAENLGGVDRHRAQRPVAIAGPTPPRWPPGTGSARTSL